MDEHIREEYPEASVFKQKAPMVRSGSKNTPICAREFAVEPDPNTVVPFSYHFESLVQFGFDSMEYTSIFKSLAKDVQEKVKTFVKKLVKLNGLPRLILSGTTIDCHVSHAFCYTTDTIKVAFNETDFELVQEFSTDAIGHVTTKDKETSLSVVFKKLDIK